MPAPVQRTTGTVESRAEGSGGRALPSMCAVAPYESKEGA